MGAPKVPGLSDRWAQHQLDLLDLADDLGANGMAERCYRPRCSGWITGASDYCSEACERLCATESSSGHETVTEAGA